MEEIFTNETWNSTGKLIERVIVKITTNEDGTITKEILSQEEF
jgi:hypothetical protein